MWTPTRAQLPVLVALLSLSLPANAQPATPAPSPPAEVPPPSGAGSDIKSNPLAYHVPGAWREKVRVFLDPGPKGLDGGFVLRDLALGHDIMATFAGPSGELIVRVIPAPVVRGDETWKGQRVALRVEQARGPTAPAVAHLQRLLSEREEGWGWLRRDPRTEEKDTAAKAARRTMRQARRLAWLGQTEQAVGAVQGALKGAPGDVPAHLTGARSLYRAGRPSLGKLHAEAVLETVRKGLETQGLDEALQARTRHHVARALCLAGLAEEALALGQEVAGGPYGCEVVRLARDLFLINATGEAITLVDAIASHDPTCDTAQALRVDLLSRTGRGEDALSLAKSLVAERTGLTATRSAWARAALRAGDLKTATLQAGVPVERGGASDDSVITLAAVLAAGGAELAPLPRWENMLERNPTTANRGLGAAVFFVQNQYDEAVEQLEAVQASIPNAVGLAAMRAVVLARAGKVDAARAALDTAWETDEAGTWSVAAEAELAEVQARTADATSAWTAYVTLRQSELGPLTVTQARERLAALERGTGGGATQKLESERSGTPETPTPAEPGEKDRIPTWGWLVLVVVGAGALYGWRRKSGPPTGADEDSG